MEPFDTKIASLTYLTNPLYQQIIKQQKEIKSASNKSDIKFYRKRIASLTKEMLKGEIPDNEYIKSIYETYVNGLIKYFKMVDTSDIIQKQYGDDDDDEIIQKTEDNIHDDLINVCVKEVSVKEVSVNDILMRKISGPSTLDNFVIKTQHSTPDTRIIPIMLDIDLKEPSLRKKGVKDKPVKDKPVKDKPVKDKPVKEAQIKPSILETIPEDNILQL
jgi:hypothetical protein